MKFIHSLNLTTQDQFATPRRATSRPRRDSTNQVGLWLAALSQTNLIRWESLVYISPAERWFG